MAFTRTAVKYKPLRVGFLVREGHIEDIVEAAGINSILWGGIHNPIIPISEGDNKFAEQLLDLFSVDILYSVSDVPEIQAFRGKHPFLRDPRNWSDSLFFNGWHSEKQICSLLDIKNIADLFWEKDYKNRDKGYKSHFASITWSDDDPLKQVFAIQFGFFPKIADLKWKYKEIFLKGLRAQEIEIPPLETLNISNKIYSLIQTTAAGLTSYSTGPKHNRDGIYIGDSESFEDLVNFWNIRAADMNVVFFPKNHSDRCLPYVQSHLDYLGKRPRSKQTIEYPLDIYHRLDNTDEIKELDANFDQKIRVVWHHVSEHSWNGLNIQPSYQVFKWQSASAHVESSQDKYAVNIHLPEKTFLVDNNGDSEFKQQQLGVILDFYGDHGYPGYTLKLPRIRKLNEFYGREIAFDPGKLRVEMDGFTVIIDADEDSLNLQPLSKPLLLERLFSTVGIHSKVSQPGLITSKIIEKMGGLEEARVFKIKGVRKILQEGSPGTFLSRGDAVKIIFENDFEKHKNLYIESRVSGELNANSVFDFLLKKDLFRAGLELTCSHCNLKNWLSLKVIDDNWSCEYCGSQNQTSLHLKHRGDWKFRKSGLFAKDNHQEGTIPVLLTLLAIKRVSDHADFSYSTALELKGAGISDCEIDFCVVQKRRRDDEIEIGIGECKSDGGSINEDDCNKLKKVAKKLEDLTKKTKVYIIFSKTNDLFTVGELTLFFNLNREGYSVIILTNKELEPYHIYWKESGETDSDVPHKYVHSLEELSENSYVRYLKQFETPPSV